MPDIQPFSVQRTLEAPREWVFRAHVDSDQVLRWFGPEGARVLSSRMDLRVGGSWHYGLALPDGSTTWGRQEFLEIDAPNRLVFLQTFSDPDGGLARHPLNPNWPLRLLSSAVFEEEGLGRTRLSYTWLPWEANPAEQAVFDEARPAMAEGFRGMLDALQAHLAGLR